MPKTHDDQAEIAGRAAWGREVQRRLDTDDLWTRQALAREIGVSRAQLDKYLDGLVTPPGKYIGRISDAVGIDMFEQLALLGWLGRQEEGALRRRRIERSRLAVHDELVRLVSLDAEQSGARPSMAIVEKLLLDGWHVKVRVEWMGTRRPVAYCDHLELRPPRRLTDDRADTSLDASSTPSREDEALRALAEAAIGPGLFHGRECYWASPRRDTVRDVDELPCPRPGLVLAVPWFLRRRYPRADAAILRPGTGLRDSAPASLLVLGLPYAGAPDVAAILAGGELGWGYAGMAMLAREQWLSVESRATLARKHGPIDDSQRRVEREASIAAAFARGEDPRSHRTVWFLNEPEALDDSLTGLLDGRSRTAVVELRFTKNAIEDFLLKTRGAADHGWTSEAANRWRDRCIDMEAAYNNAGHGDDWLTIDVDLGAEHVDGPNREVADDARTDVYLAQLAPVAERWIADRYQVHTAELAPEETALLDILLEGTDGAEPTISEIATRLAITLPAARTALSNLEQRLRTTSREDLLAVALWLRNCGDRA